jgi:XTP/dITP diphosphohydrolase
MKLVLATHNRDKAREITAMLEGLDAEVSTVDDFEGVPEPVEDGDTLEANAVKKAREIRDATGLSALADDTGVEVDALDGAPGVHSARYAATGAGNAAYHANCEKLLREMKHVPGPQRGARFRTVVAVALSHDDERRLDEFLDTHPETREGLGIAAGAPVDVLVAEGILPGEITTERRGRGGFGYDPLFLDPARGRTLAEMSAEEKNRVSHRYRAVVEMRELLLRLGRLREGVQ